MYGHDVHVWTGTNFQFRILSYFEGNSLSLHTMLEVASVAVSVIIEEDQLTFAFVCISVIIIIINFVTPSFLLLLLASARESFKPWTRHADHLCTTKIDSTIQNNTTCSVWYMSVHNSKYKVGRYNITPSSSRAHLQHIQHYLR